MRIAYQMLYQPVARSYQRLRFSMCSRYDYWSLSNVRIMLSTAIKRPAAIVPLNKLKNSHNEYKQKQQQQKQQRRQRNKKSQ